MSQKIRELLQKRAKLHDEAKVIMEAAEKENRANLNTEEAVKYDKIINEMGDIRAHVDRLQKLADSEKEILESADSKDKEDRGGKTEGGRGSKEYRDAFKSYLVGGRSAETRALSVGSNPDGGYLVASEQFVEQLIKFVDDSVFVRQAATKFSVPTAQSLGIPSLDTDPADPDWTAEILTGSEDSSMKVGKRSLSPSPLAKLIKVSRTLLRMASIGAEQLVLNRLGYKFAIAAEKGYLTGNGANQPLGVFTASAMGISTGRDFSTGNTTTTIGADGLIEAKYGLKGQYHPKAAWMFHRDAVKQIAKLKDGNGQYLWQPGLQAGQPDRLLNMPLMMSEYAPNTFTTGLYVGIIGDWSQYYIADALDFSVQRLDELYAATNQVGFIGRLESDGMPVLEEAFARVKLA